MDSQKEFQNKYEEWRMSRFENKSDEDKLAHMNEKLREHNQFLAEMLGSGRSYYTDITLKDSEFQWIMEKLNELFNK